uniref:Uncharacterized protein n=1 Tax=Oryza brachyantha TaxID=4533 RepID=J3MT72_ORYBR
MAILQPMWLRKRTGRLRNQMLADSLKITQVHVQAMRSSEESNSDEDDEILSELKEKVCSLYLGEHTVLRSLNNLMIAVITAQWDAIENKSSVLVYGGGAIIAVWLSLIVVKALDSVPLVHIQLVLLLPH